MLSSLEEKERVANPDPLGLLGFGMTTTLLNLHNVGILPLDIVVVAMGLGMGGLIQILVGIREMRQGNTFGGTVFSAYGMFWWTLVLIWLHPFSSLEPVTGTSLGIYLLLWCLFTVFMFICTLKHSRVTQLVFGSLTVLFLLLALENFTGSHVIGLIAGVVGIICGLASVYNSVGQVVNGEYGKKILPL